MENRMKLNKRIKYELPDEVLVGEYRYSKNTNEYREPNFEPDICIGGWGAGCSGLIIPYRKTSNQICIKTNNKQLLEFIRHYNWRSIVNKTSSYMLNIWKVKKIILEEFYGKQNEVK